MVGSCRIVKRTSKFRLWSSFSIRRAKVFKFLFNFSMSIDAFHGLDASTMERIGDVSLPFVDVVRFRQ